LCRAMKDWLPTQLRQCPPRPSCADDTCVTPVMSWFPLTAWHRAWPCARLALAHDIDRRGNVSRRLLTFGVDGDRRHSRKIDDQIVVAQRPAVPVLTAIVDRRAKTPVCRTARIASLTWIPVVYLATNAGFESSAPFHLRVAASQVASPAMGSSHPAAKASCAKTLVHHSNLASRLLLLEDHASRDIPASPKQPTRRRTRFAGDGLAPHSVRHLEVRYRPPLQPGSPCRRWRVCRELGPNSPH
jgi:hypothetical protein